MFLVTLVGSRTNWLVLGEALIAPDLQVQVIDEALPALDSFVIESTGLYVVDIDLADMEIASFIRGVRAAGSSAPIIIASPLERRERLALLEAGANGLLRAPVDGLEFVSAVYAHLNAGRSGHAASNDDPLKFTPGMTAADNFQDAAGQRIVHAHKGFLSNLQAKITEAAGGSLRLSIFSVHVGGISDANHDLGFNAGDRMIEVLSTRLQQFAAARQVTIARIAGDEFAVLLSPATAQTIDSVADEILALCDEPVEIAGERLACLPNMGIAVFPKDGLTAEDLFKAATGAMLQALASGQDNRICHAATDGSPEDVPEDLSTALDKALVANELDLYYQPQIDLQSGDYCGVEAFVRWPRPGRGDVRPEDLFAAAGTGALLGRLTGWIAGRLVSDGMRLKAAGLNGLVLVMGLSLEQVLLPDLAAILETLGTSQTDGQVVELAISTQTALNLDAIPVLEGLKRQGFHLCLRLSPKDSSKINLPLEFNRVKIDSQEDSGFEALAGIARAYGVPVIGSNIEDASQLARLRKYQFYIAQGYYIQSPVSLLQLIALYRGN
jgi:diguanylate cyclase (GGDEF)-like protein